MPYQRMGTHGRLAFVTWMRHWAWCVCRRWPRPRVGSGRAPNVRNNPFHYSIGEVRRVCCAAILRQEEFHYTTHSFVVGCEKGDFNGRTGWAWAIKNGVEISPAVRLGHRERAISCRKAWPPVMAATRTPLRVSNLPLDLRMELRGRSGLAIVVVVVVDDAGQGQVQGDCVFLLSQIGAGGGRGRPGRGPA